jgi:hypothetical protein
MADIKCLCVNAKNKPSGIPIEKWVVEMEQYSVISMIRDKDGKLGIQVSEIDLDETCKPYEMFDIRRFAFRGQDITALQELGQVCSEIDWDTPMLEQLNLQTIEQN